MFFHFQFHSLSFFFRKKIQISIRSLNSQLHKHQSDDGLIDITQERWKEIMEFMSTAHSSGGGVLVHCAQGVNRSGTVVCAYLMVSQKWKYEKALEIARKGRAICQPNKQYERQLKAMESFLHTLNV